MTEAKSVPRKWYDFIELKFSAGTLLVLFVQIVCGVAYIVVNLATIKDLKVSVDHMQETQAAMSIQMPMLTANNAMLNDGLKEERGERTALSSRVGTLEQLTSGFKADIETLKGVTHDLASASYGTRIPRGIGK